MSAPPAAAPSGVTRPIPGQLLRLAFPLLASQLLRVAYQWVDAIWVRGLGVEATAAVTTSAFVMWTVFALHDVFGIGVAVYVSQLLGAGDRQRAGVAAWMGIRASAVVGLAGTVVGLTAARAVYGLMHADPKIADLGGRYLSIVLGAAPIPMMALTCETIMRSSGDTRTPLAIDLIAVTLNAVLCPALIYGCGPIPPLGIAGAAWATVSAQTMLLAGYLLMAARGHRAFPLARRAPGLPVRIAGMARVGFPAALIGMLFSAVYIAFVRAAAPFGAAAIAMVGIANRIEAVQLAAAAAVGIAGAALVGQNLGARRPERAAQVIRTGLAWGIGFSLVMTAICLAAPQPFIALFTSDPEALRIGVPYLRVLALCFPAVAIEVVTAESIMGSGHTTVVSAIYTAFSLARIPLAFLVPRWTGGRVLSIAWLITITCIVRALVIVLWAARGTWKRGMAAELHGEGVAAEARAP